MRSTRMHRIAGALALVGLLAAGSWARAADSPDESALRKMYDQATRRDYSFLDAEAAVRAMRACFPDSPALPEMEFEMGKALWRAYEREGFLPEGPAGKPTVTLGHLERFLPGQPYASFGAAGHACALYAKGLLAQRKADEAKAILVSQIQTGKPSAKGTAFKALVLLRDALPVDDDQIASLEQTVCGSIASRKNANRIEDEFLGLLSAAGDPSAGLARSFALTRLHMESAGELIKVKRLDQAVVRYRQAVAAGEASLAQCSNPPADEELPRWLRVRASLAVAESFLGDPRKCAELAGSVVKYKDDPAIGIYRPAVQASLFWNQAREDLGLAPKDEIDADLTTLLATGKCRAEEVYWIFAKLATHAGQRGDTALEYLYWRDARDRLYDLACTFVPARKAADLEQRRPELKQTPADVRSPANDAMEAAGLAVADPSQLPKAPKVHSKAARQAALNTLPKQPEEVSAKFYKTFTQATTEETEADETPSPIP
ncbi:MAG: hypothetical protein NTW86_29625 [Candidatus Sumerlaeota bacterium]|nr:hypothetical protein [Candidatus Sumerlaeota bacterium]